MQVKTYTGSSTPEVLAQIKTELGPDAVILGSRTYRKNGVRCHEITVGIDRPVPSEQPDASSAPSGAEAVRAAARAVVNATSAARAVTSGGVSMSGMSAYAADGAPAGWSEWHREWLQIKEHLFALMKPSIQLERLTPRQRVALEYLQREGISDAVSVELYRRMLATPGVSVLESLSDMLPVRSWAPDKWPQRLHLVGGPFGAGKTTSALRMALALRQQVPDINVAFINADCNRGNGRLILRHWAELSNFSYYEASDAAGMERALAACAEADRIFVDLPGLTRDMSLGTLRAHLGLADREAVTHLVLSPHHDSMQLTAFLSRYGVEGEGSLVWTKLDEAVSYGTLVNVAVACKLPVSALSHGPGLKQTLTPASEPMVWRLIFKRQLPGERSAPAGEAQSAQYPGA